MQPTHFLAARDCRVAGERIRYGGQKNNRNMSVASRGTAHSLPSSNNNSGLKKGLLVGRGLRGIERAICAPVESGGVLTENRELPAQRVDGDAVFSRTRLQKRRQEPLRTTTHETTGVFHRAVCVGYLHNCF